MSRNREWMKPGERLDDLQRNGLQVIQDPGGFCFGMDAVLLSHFTRLKPMDQVIDLGTGSGVIPLLLAGKDSDCRITGVELQAEAADRAQRSVRLNELEERIQILHQDIRELETILPAASFTVATSNPPYLPAGSHVNPDQEKALARHEITLTLEDVMRQASYLLQPCGRLYMVHRPQRLADLMVLGRKYRLEPKWMQMVYGHGDRPPTMILVQLVKNGKPELKHMEPLVVYQSDGQYTPELLACYGAVDRQVTGQGR